MSETISPNQGAEPLAAALTAFIAKHDPGTRMHKLGTALLRGHGQTRDRRAAVLKHKDLAERLVAELGYAKPGQWNGYIPPAATDPGGQDRLCQGTSTGPRGDILSRLNQVGRYAIGEMPNNSLRREALLDISREAWSRERKATAPAPSDSAKEDTDAT